MQCYLRHLEHVGFTFAPRFLGIDGRGREVLSYVEGEMTGRPLRPWAGDEEVLAAVARIQRRLHDCSEGFALPPGMSWQEPTTLAGVLPPYDEADVIGHNDVTPENVIFRAGRPVAFIDFDLAGPTTRLLDVVTTMLHWAPLRAPEDRDPVLRDLDTGRRMRAYADAYGLGASQRSQLVDVADRRFARSWPVMRHHAEHRGGGWARMWDDGVGDLIRRSHAWLLDQRPSLEDQLRY